VSQSQRIAFVGNSLPRRCGIATFTTDLRKAVASLDPDIETCIVAMTDNDRTYDYPAEVRLEIADQSIEDYAYAADILNDGRYDVVSLQHEFGIFGGEAGDHILTLLNRLNMPVVTTLHTVLSQPSRVQRALIDRIVAISARVVVMAEKGRELLQKVYDVPADKIEVIPHDIPDIAFAEPEEAKARFGFTGKAVILTFGLLSPNKGIEYVIDAMPAKLTSRFWGARILRREIRLGSDLTNAAATTEPVSSRWGPFGHLAFAVIWTASLVSNVGTAMFDTASGWLITSLDANPITVSLVQVAVSLPLFLFTLPSGALADVIDSRRLLIAVEVAILAVSMVFAGLVSRKLATPSLLLATTFLLGVGGALTSPAWGATIPMLVPSRISTARPPPMASPSTSGAPLGRRSAGW
jgi:hypothetical protein